MKAHRYVISRTESGAELLGTIQSWSSRRAAWKDFLKHCKNTDKAYWQKLGLKSWRVKVTAEVVG